MKFNSNASKLKITIVADDVTDIVFSLCIWIYLNRFNTTEADLNETIKENLPFQFIIRYGLWRFRLKKWGTRI